MKLQHDVPLSNFALNSKLRRYIKAKETADALSKAAETLNSKNQADAKVGEEKIAEAAKRADTVAAAADKARPARCRPPRHRHAF